MKQLKSFGILTLSLLLLLGTVFPSSAQNQPQPKERIKYAYRSSILSTTDVPQKINYDVVVFGSDPEGIAAAYSAGMQGLNVLLVDFGRDRVGGLYTLGWLNMIDFNYAPGQQEWYANVYPDNFLNHGFFERFFKLIGQKKAFDIDVAQSAFEQLLKEANVEVVLTSDKAFEYKYIPAQKTSVIELNSESEPVVLTAKVVIDALPNADVAVKAGAKFLEGKEDVGLKGQYQSATLVYKLRGVNWDAVKVALQNDNDAETGMSQNAAWGYKNMLTAPVNHPLMQSRHLNLGRQNDGTVMVNAFQIFEFKPYDTVYQIQTRDEAIRRIKNDIIPYMRANLKGFENAEFVSAAPEFYIRETKHLISEQNLTANDVFDSVFPSNYIASGSYPIDIQAKHKGDIGTILTGTKPYGIGAGAIIPKGIDGIYVVSKCAGFDSIAYGSARTVPVLMALGEAAGAMASTAIKYNATTRDILTNSRNLLSVRTALYDRGVRLVSYPNAHPIDGSYAAKEIRFLRSKAFVTMTYQNEYNLQGKATVARLYTMVNLMENNSPYDISRGGLLTALKNKPMAETLKLGDMIAVMNYFARTNYVTLEDFRKNGILPQNIYDVLMQKAFLHAEDLSKQQGALRKSSQSDINNPALAAELEYNLYQTELIMEDLYALMGNVILKTPVKQMP